MSEPINLDEIRGNARGGVYGSGQLVVMQLCDEVERLRNAAAAGILVPAVTRLATGRTIPDLTKKEHVCEWQRRIELAEMNNPRGE